MTDKQQALRDLLAKVEVGEWDDMALAYKISSMNPTSVRHAYNGSTDAALALRKSVVPEWRPRIELGGFNSYNMARPADMWTVILWHTDPMSIHALDGASGSDKDPARALLIAILKALIAKGEA